MKTRHTTTFIQDESQVPAGYVAMPEFGVNGTEYKAVSRAQKTGLIRAVKLVRHEGDLKGGAVWVHKSDADAYLRSLVMPEVSTTVETQSSTTVDVSAAVQSLASIDTTLDEIYRVLERLTAAVENIATQPKAEPVGTWRDMNGECH
jgi:hypothetical protein